MSVALSFVSPPPGLAPHTDFALTAIDEAEGLFALRAVAVPDLRLYVVDPRTVIAGYEPVLTDEQVADLGLHAPEDAMLLVVAHPATAGVSVNLLAPVVVNRTTGRAAQVILDGQDYDVRTPLG
ncbi:flagellar assembly protein FliW [Microbacterium sp. CIAB417]|uniref:flagellar assembly protein FliW n=1 Tax=Microbacterium sp. CIAB417 TaxID=2860287 RepID=UPI001FACFDD5|nr:flagellar assembly protein FliW [Microbacterium sp. CIAB417]